MRGDWELITSRPGGTVASLFTSGSDVIAATPAGLRHSADGGRTWMARGPALAPPMEVAVPAPGWVSSGVVLAGTGTGLFRSTDRGATWAATLVGSRVTAIAFASDEQVLVGTEQDGILRSEDGGRTFKSGNPGLIDLTVVGITGLGTLDAGQTAYAATASGVFQTRNGGRAWRAIDTLPGEPVLQCILATSSVVLVGSETDGLFQSADGGARWTIAESWAGRGVTALAGSDDGRLAAAGDTGVAVSNDAGETWRWSGRDLGPVLGLAFAPNGSLLASVPRRGVLRCDDGQTWVAADGGLRANLAVALEGAADGRLYLAGLEDGIVVSLDGGLTWAPTQAADLAVFGLSANASYAASSTGVLKRQSDEWQYLNNFGVRAVCSLSRAVAALRLDGQVSFSDDAGESWRELVLPARAGTPHCLDLADASTVLVGTVNGVWRGADRAEWTHLLEAERVTTLIAGPSHSKDGLVFAALDDQVRSPLPGMTQIVGRQRRPVWRQASMPGRITALAVAPRHHSDRTVLAGTSAGVCVSEDAGESFTAWTEGMGELPTVALAFSPGYASDRAVYAVELGGRIWRARNGE